MDINEKLQSVPNQPGAYLIKDGEGNILYVGKASSLRKRLRQHFRNEAKGGPWHQIMISRATDFDFILARSDLEALILEANLIKEHHPRFNVQLADDKSYPYIKITDEPFPRLMLVRDLPKNAHPASGRVIRRGFHDPRRQEVHYRSSGKLFGPYPNSKAMRRTMRLASQLFGIRSCRRELDGTRVGRPCLDYHIKRCVGPCTGEVSQEEYAGIVRQVELFLSGRSGQIVDQLEKQMRRAAEQLQFERAAVLRDKLSSLRQVLEDQVMASTGARDEDVIAVATDKQRALVVLMTVRAGKLVNQQRFPLLHTAGRNEAEIIEAFMTHHYTRTGWAPQLVLVSRELPDTQKWADMLSELRGSQVEVRWPQRGEKRRLIELAQRNAQVQLMQMSEARGQRREAAAAALSDLAEMLQLAEPPHRIECYDVSNISGEHATASMVVFTEGVADKDSYRRFNMRETAGKPDDYAMMREVLTRRLKRAGVGDEKFLPLPDLIVVDGGKGQLNVAVQVLDDAKMDIDVVALAKQEEEVFVPGQPEPVDSGPYPRALLLLQRVRDEAHRFAVAHHRALRGQAMTKSILDDIPGIGPRRRQELLKAFPSVVAMSRATVEELATVPAMSRPAARSLLEHLTELVQ